MSYNLAPNKEHVYAIAYVLLTRTHTVGHTRFAYAHTLSYTELPLAPFLNMNTRV